MRNRALAFTGVSAVAIAVVWLMPIRAAGQAAKPAAKPAAASTALPRTAGPS